MNFEEFQQPEYIHVLLNPLPIYGLGLGVLACALALFLRPRAARVVALAIVCISAASAWPVYHYGEQGYDRVKSMSDEDGEAWLEEHMERAEKLISAFYVLAALAAVAIFAPRKWPRSDRPLAIITLSVGVLTLGAAAWIGYAGGKIRHKEFRDGPPPARPEHHHEH